MSFMPLASFIGLGHCFQLQTIFEESSVGALGALAGRSAAFAVKVTLAVVLQTPTLLTVAPPSVSRTAPRK